MFLWREKMKTAESIAYEAEMDRRDEMNKWKARQEMEGFIDFSDLEELDDQGNLAVETKSGSSYQKKVGFGHSSVDTGERFVENCPTCKGGGRFISWAGRDVGPCFKCKGKGKIAYKNPAHVREKHKADRENRKVNKVDQFANSHPEVVNWLNANTSFDFAVSLKNSLYKYGSLTDKQIAAVQKCIDRNAVRQIEREKDATEIDVTNIQKAFTAAMSGGFKNLKLRMVGFTFSLAKPNSANPGAIYVTNHNEYCGKIINGKFFPCNCGQEVIDRLVEVAENPEAAAIAYGQQTGNCSCCGRTLTRKDSIERGIGPICATKYGW
jgi:hypothetical protein